MSGSVGILNGSIDILVLDDGSADEQVVRALLSADPALNVVAYAGGLGHHVPPSDAVIVACGQYSEGAANLIRDAVSDRPARPVVVVMQGVNPNGSVEHAFEAGAADLVFLPRHCDAAFAAGMGPQIRFTIDKAVGGRRKDHDGAEARMIVVLGPKGGSGKTLAATNLAASLADGGHRVAIVDLDLQFGDVGLALGLSPDTTVYDLISSGGSLDIDKLDAFLVEHSSGARALLAPRRPDEAGLVTVEFLREVYNTLRKTYDVVVVDTPPSFTPEVISAIDASSDVLLVSMLDALALKNTRLGTETLELMGYPASSIRFLLNRADSQVGVDLNDVQAIVGLTPDVMVPSDRQITRSVNEGVPIALKLRGSDAGKAFRDLAAIYAPAEAAAVKPGRRLSIRRRQR